jgi:hypothetical protein
LPSNVSEWLTKDTGILTGRYLPPVRACGNYHGSISDSRHK